MDNVIFSVNGDCEERLRIAIALIMMGRYGTVKKVRGMKKTQNGLEFYFHTVPQDVQKFPMALDVSAVYPLVLSYLADSEAIANVTLEDMEMEYTGDGSDKIGWRVYTDKWGQMSDCDGFAVKPVHCWYGK